MTQPLACDRALDEAVHAHFAVVAELAVAKHAARADLHAVAELHLSFEDHVDVEDDVAAAAHRAAHVEARRIDHGDAGAHQFRRAARAMRRFGLGELELVVHPENLRGRACDDGLDRTAVAHGGHDAVGQIILPLRVVGLERAEPAAELRRRRREHAGVDLVDRALLVVRVLVLDDARDAPGRVAYHAAVAGRIREPRGKQRERFRARSVRRDPSASRRGSAARRRRARARSGRPARRASPACTACPVPFCSAWRSQRMSPPAIAARTWSAPWPWTTWIASGSRARAVATTCARSGRPASGCSTFGRSLAMRLPWPAARMTTERGIARIVPKPLGATSRS